MTPGRTPSLFDKCTGFFYMPYTTHGTNGFTSHPKDEETSLTAGDSNSHSADQKHQSLKFGDLNCSATTLPRERVRLAQWCLASPSKGS